MFNVIDEKYFSMSYLLIGIYQKDCINIALKQWHNFVSDMIVF